MAYMYTNYLALHGRESRVTIQSRRELNDRSSMTATLGKYIYTYRINREPWPSGNTLAW